MPLAAKHSLRGFFVFSIWAALCRPAGAATPPLSDYNACAPAIFVSAAHCAACASGTPNTADYYTVSGLTACQYPDATLPGGTTTASQLYAAVNGDMFLADDLCGACALVTNESGDASNGETVTVMITDECPATGNPDCAAGDEHLDLSPLAFGDLDNGTANGSISVNWQIAPCPVGFFSTSNSGGDITYEFKSGSSASWDPIILRDYVNPIQSVSYCSGLGTGCAATVWNNTYNGWVPNTAMGTFYVQITDDAGQVSNFGPITCCANDPGPTNSDPASDWVDLGGQLTPCVAGSPGPTSTASPTSSDTPTLTPYAGTPSQTPSETPYAGTPTGTPTPSPYAGSPTISPSDSPTSTDTDSPTPFAGTPSQTPSETPYAGTPPLSDYNACAPAIFVSAAHCAACASGTPNTADYYTVSGLTACQYPDATLPGGTTTASQLYAAVNGDMFLADDLCGACALVTNESGDASNGETVTVMITDECPATGNPDCAAGDEHLDLSPLAFGDLDNGTANGSISVNWKITPCPVGFFSTSNSGGDITYEFKSGSSASWDPIILRDYVNPIQSVSYCSGLGTGCAATVWNNTYNGWVPNTAMGTFYVQITDDAGQVSNFGPITCCANDPGPTNSDPASDWVDLGGQLTPCVAGSPSRTSTASPTSSDTPTLTPYAGTPSQTPSETPYAGTPTGTPTPSPYAGSPTISPSDTPTRTDTDSPTPFAGTPSQTPSETPYAGTPTGTPTPSPYAGSPTISPSDSPTSTVTSTGTLTDYAGTPTETPYLGTPTETPSETPYAGSPTASPAQSGTDTPTDTPTQIPTAYAGTPTETPYLGTPTETPSETPYAGTPTATPAESPTGTYTETALPSPSQTPFEVVSAAINPSQASVVSLGDGTTISLPAGAFAVPVTLTVQGYSAQAAPQTTAFEFLNTVYSINAGGPLLQAAVEITFPYQASEIPAPLTASDLSVSYYDGTSWTTLVATVNTVNQTLTVVTSHFSLWAITAKAKDQGTAVTVASDPSVLGLAALPQPNPKRIGIQLDQGASAVRLRLFNTGFRLVAQWQAQDLSGGWNNVPLPAAASGLPNGLYFLQAIAVGGGGKLSRPKTERIYVMR